MHETEPKGYDVKVALVSSNDVVTETGAVAAVRNYIYNGIEY